MSGIGATFSNLAGMSEPEPPREKGYGHTAGGGGGGRNATEPTREKGNAQPAASRNSTEPPVIPGLAELVEVLNAMATAPPGVRPQLNQELIERIRDSPLSPVLKELNPVYHKLGPPEGSQEAQAQAAQRAEAHPPPPQPASTPGPGPSPSQAHPPQPTSTSGHVPSSAQQPLPTPTALDVAELKSMQAGLRSISSTLDSVAQVVTVRPLSPAAGRLGLSVEIGRVLNSVLSGSD